MQSREGQGSARIWDKPCVPSDTIDELMIQLMVLVQLMEPGQRRSNGDAGGRSKYCGRHTAR